MSNTSPEGAHDAPDSHEITEARIPEGAQAVGEQVVSAEYQEYLDGLSPFARDLLRPSTPFEKFAAQMRRKKYWPKA